MDEGISTQLFLLENFQYLLIQSRKVILQLLYVFLDIPRKNISMVLLHSETLVFHQ